MTVGDRVVLTLQLRDIDPGARGTILSQGGSGYRNGFEIKFDGFERHRFLGPEHVEPLPVLDALSEIELKGCE